MIETIRLYQLTAIITKGKPVDQSDRSFDCGSSSKNNGSYSWEEHRASNYFGKVFEKVNKTNLKHVWLVFCEFTEFTYCHFNFL